jgi:hypothetical protein
MGNLGSYIRMFMIISTLFFCAAQPSHEINLYKPKTIYLEVEGKAVIEIDHEQDMVVISIWNKDTQDYELVTVF